MGAYSEDKGLGPSAFPVYPIKQLLAMHPKLPTAHSTARPFWKDPKSKITFDTVSDLASYPLLFRISHKNSGSHYFHGHGVVASEHYSVDAETGKRYMNNTIEHLCGRTSGFTAIRTDKLANYLLYIKNERTNFVSTTLSFSWALFFAEMNANNWKEEDVEFLVIDTLAVAHRSWITHEKLNTIGGKPNNPTYRKVLNAAYSSQEVIVADCIPESAIVSRTRWDVLKEELPSWFYEPFDYIGSRRIIPIPNDKLQHKYTRWQNAIQKRLHQLSVLSSLRWECVSRSEVVAFVLSVLSPKSFSDTGVVLQNGMKTQQNLEILVQSAARALLEWSRGFSSSLLQMEDIVHIPRVARGLMAEKIANTEDSPTTFGDRSVSPHSADSVIGKPLGSLCVGGAVTMQLVV